MAEILGAILVHLPGVDQPEVRRLLIEGILLLAHHHQETVLTALLRQPLPMERWMPPRPTHSAARSPLGASVCGGGGGLTCQVPAGSPQTLLPLWPAT